MWGSLIELIKSVEYLIFVRRRSRLARPQECLGAVDREEKRHQRLRHSKETLGTYHRGGASRSYAIISRAISKWLLENAHHGERVETR